VQPFRTRLVGHRQITDAYLLGLALHKQAKLATMDKPVYSLLPEKAPERAVITLIPRSGPL
jgi:hypothetical protein